MDKTRTMELLEGLFRYVSESVTTTREEGEALATAIAMLARVPGTAFAEDMAGRLYRQGAICCIEDIYATGVLGTPHERSGAAERAARGRLAAFGVRSVEDVLRAGVRNDAILANMRAVLPEWSAGHEEGNGTDQERSGETI